MLQPVLTQINRLDISRQTTNLTKSKDSTLGAILVRGFVREIQGVGGGELFDSRPFHFASRFFLISCKDSIPLLSLFNCTFYFCMKKTRGRGEGGGTPDMKWVGMLIVSLRGVNFGLWSHLGCSGQDTIIFSREGLVEGCTRKNLKIHI